MLYRAKATYSEGPKELGGNRIRRADFNCPKGYSIPYDIMWKEFWREWDFISAAQVVGWASVRGWWTIACASPVVYIHIYICSHNYYPLSSVLVNRFISTHKFNFFFFFFPVLFPIPLRREAVNKWFCIEFCSAEPPASLNHNRYLQEVSVQEG